MAPPNVDVTPDKPLHITDSYRDFGIVTIKPGGQIFVETTADVKIKELNKGTPPKLNAALENAGVNLHMALAAAASPTPDMSIVGAAGSAGTNAANGVAGTPGINGKDASCNWASGCNDGSAGTNGSAGGAAGDASDGGKGGDAPPVRMSVGTLTGTVFISAGGGAGGNGGKGGDGGVGGNGGNGGCRAALKSRILTPKVLLLRLNPGQRWPRCA